VNSEQTSLCGISKTTFAASWTFFRWYAVLSKEEPDIKVVALCPYNQFLRCKQWRKQMANKNNRESQSNTQKLLTHDEIEKRAYALYQQGGEDFSATEYWLLAEEELKKATAETNLPKEKTATAVGRAV
jgi:hypothetical protein